MEPDRRHVRGEPALADPVRIVEDGTPVGALETTRSREEVAARNGRERTEMLPLWRNSVRKSADRSMWQARRTALGGPRAGGLKACSQVARFGKVPE
jgi:hypothetical protein